MTLLFIDSVISGYISELHVSGIDNFSYTLDNTLYIYRNTLSEYHYKLVNFISELIYIRILIKNTYGNFTIFDIQKHISFLQKKYQKEIVSFYPLACVIDSLLMEIEKEV